MIRSELDVLLDKVKEPALRADPANPHRPAQAASHLRAGLRATQDGSTWRRLPKTTPPADGHGAYLWSAGPAGVLAEIASKQSANGWDWTPFPGPSKGELATILALHGSTMVAAGMTDRESGPLLGSWVGSVTYAR